jgi:phage terminase large subunit GpA-like protein
MARSKTTGRLTDPETLDQLQRLSAPRTTHEAFTAYRRRRLQASRRVYTPVPRERYWEWAEQHFYLDDGLYDQSRVEPARGPLSAPTEPGVREIVIVGSVQFFKTTFSEVVQGYHIHRDPTRMMLMLDKDEMSKKFSREKLGPNILRSPELRSRVRPSLGREGDSTLLYKAFPGGSLVLTSAGSPSNLAMLKFRIVMLDEIDKYTDTDEGDAIQLASKRMLRYPYNSLMILTCSPTNQHSRIWKAYLKSDMRKMAVACPDPACGHLQVLDWGTEDSLHGVKWSSTGESPNRVHHPETAEYACAACGSLMSNQQRMAALRNVRWYQTKPLTAEDGTVINPVDHLNDRSRWLWDEWAQVHYFIDPETGKRLISNYKAGFWASSLYNPSRTLEQLARNFLEVKNNPQELQTFVNTELALPWLEEAQEVDRAGLKARMEPLPFVPDEAHLVVATVDVQGDRLEVTHTALNLANEQAWVLKHKQLWGPTGEHDVWASLAPYLGEPLHRRDGLPFRPCVTLVDVNFNRANATQWVNRNKGRGAFAIVGKAEQNGQRSEMWPPAASFKNALRTPIHNVSSNAAKDFTIARLQVKDPAKHGYIHLSDGLTDEYVDQISSEKLVIRFKGGKSQRLWELRTKGHVRNEGWDLLVYAMIALKAIQSFPAAVQQKMCAPPPKPDTGAPKPFVPTIPRSEKSLTPVEASLGDAQGLSSPQTKPEKAPVRLPPPGSPTSKMIRVPKGMQRRR